ncbi:hypothetical protein [uncultured Polaribacter sp.]|uniref:hypothetical protein n=1 Tax=uncultured Polaribacter sp. TaxID=174711 RepID=UPI00261E9A99|nr:hypothetical protein [uncultured Polaribacter sp.]
MKKTYKIISTVAIVLFGISYVFDKFGFLSAYNPDDLRSILVMVYLFTSLRYNQIEIEDKGAEIQHLKLKLKKFEE